VRTLTALATAYFVVVGVSGYIIHQAFVMSDVIVVIGGLFFIIVYPRLVSVVQRK
jgi:hypothetical protein